MYSYKNAYKQEDPFVTKVSEIRDLAEVAEDAISIVKTQHQYCPFQVISVHVVGGVHERDCGYMEFDDHDYPYWDGKRKWSDLLIADFEKDQNEKLTGGWFNTLNFTSVIITLLAQSVPIVMTLRNGNLELSLSYPECWANTEKRVLERLEQMFGTGKKE